MELIDKGLRMMFIQIHFGDFFHRHSVKCVTFLFFLFLTPLSYSKDLLHNELDLLISQTSFSEYFNQISQSELSSSNTEIGFQQDGSISQTHLSHYSFKNTIDIYQTGTNNIADINIVGKKNRIQTKQIGEGNNINIHQQSNESLTTVEQFGNYNQVIINIQGNNQINRITQIGSYMTAIIRN